MAGGHLVEPEDLGFAAPPETALPSPEVCELATLKDARDALERDMILTAIRQQGGNIAKAAEILGVSRPTLYDLMKKHGI
jgi:two-component system NtrC family response regulator